MPQGRILIVDDDLDALESLAEILRDEGMTVETASGPSAAMRTAAAFGPEIVLVDLHMPEGGGLALARSLKDRDRTTRIIVVTGSDIVDIRDDLIGAGNFVDAICSKPIHVAALLALVMPSPLPHAWNGTCRLISVDPLLV